MINHTRRNSNQFQSSICKMLEEMENQQGQRWWSSKTNTRFRGAPCSFGQSERPTLMIQQKKHKVPRCSMQLWPIREANADDPAKKTQGSEVLHAALANQSITVNFLPQRSDEWMPCLPQKLKLKCIAREWKTDGPLGQLWLVSESQAK